MSKSIETFRQAESRLPQTYLSWELYGKGIECLGREHKPVELPLRKPEADEVLLRVDAIGLCFSDTKLIWAGNEHPRIRERDLEHEPTVPGHEAAMTVVAVGSRRQENFQIGQRYLIQADIYINGEQKAFGYVQRGALAQYVYAGSEIIAGDEGCYLLPLKSTTGYAEAALVEPWTCVEAAYNIPQRTTLTDSGKVLLLGINNEDLIDLTGVCGKKKPAKLVSLGLVKIKGVEGEVISAAQEVTPENIVKAVDKFTDGAGFTDIIVLGNASAEICTACDKALAENGILCLRGEAEKSAIDIGRVHYKNTRHVGGQAGTIAEIYKRNTRRDIKDSGAAWFIGAAGPMGQMHVQRSLELTNPPTRVLCTDVSNERLDYLYNRLAPIAKSKGVEMLCLNPLENQEFQKQAQDFTRDNGFTDIVVLAPVPILIENAIPNLADGGVMNIFAGVALGTEAKINLQTIINKGIRIIGSSGSGMDAIKMTLAKTEAGQLTTNNSLAGVGDIYQAWAGIKAVKEGIYPGKIVIYPQLQDLKLQSPEKLQQTCPSAYAKLTADGFWNNAAEEALFSEKLL